MKITQTIFHPNYNDGSEETTGPPDESSRFDDEVLLNEYERQRISLTHNCKCICSKNCDCVQHHFGTNNYFADESSCWKCNICSCCRGLRKAYLIFGLILSLLGLGFSYFFMEGLIENLVEGKLALKDGTERFSSWERGEPPILCNFWIFNLTNEKSFMRGARPLLREAGPYVYEVREKKKKVLFDDEDTLTFYPLSLFKFMPHLSYGSENDVITTLNVPLVNAGVEVQDSVVLQSVLKIASRVHNFRSLKELTVGELLWGHTSKVLNWARKFKNIAYPYQKFGVMAGKNNTIQPSYTINTGASDISKILDIKLYGGKSSLGKWGSEYCDRVHGSIVGGFHPKLLPTETLHIFAGQLCRTLPLVYEKNVTNSGLTAYRFVPPPNTLSYGDDNPTNQCFCSDNKCPPKGVLDVRPCYFGAAIAFSFPHFYQGDPTLRHIVRGLRPDPELHGTQFDIYPALGVPLRVKLRMQMNVVIDGNQALQRDRHYDVVFPVFWFEAGIDSLPGEMVGMLKMAQDLPSVVKTTSVTICATLTVLFLLLLLASTLSGWCGITPQSSRTQTPDHLPDTHWPANHPHPILNSSGYTAGSLASLGPDDSYRAVPPPYRKTLYQNGDVLDGFQTLQSDERPPAYTSAPNTTKASSSSLLSVEIHKSASLHSLDGPSTPTESDHEFMKRRLTMDSGEICFEANPERISMTPSPTIDAVNATPLSFSEYGHCETATDHPQIISSPQNYTIENSSDTSENTTIDTPLATSSPHDSPSSTSVYPSAPILPEAEDMIPGGSATFPRPPPLESDL